VNFFAGLLLVVVRLSTPRLVLVCLGGRHHGLHYLAFAGRMGVVSNLVSKHKTFITDVCHMLLNPHLWKVSIPMQQKCSDGRKLINILGVLNHSLNWDLVNNTILWVINETNCL
jgi:hypothetical protein